MSAELNTKNTIIFRADGNSQIGLGHVIRCLALAELLNNDFHCRFAIQDPSPEIVDQIKAICPEIILLLTRINELEKEADELIKTFSGQEIIVLDGYQFTTDYQQILKQKGNVLVCLDDLHDRHFVADAIINIAGGVAKNAYSVAPYTKLCLGPAYALLRKPFREVQKMVSPEPEKAQRILICFGGADLENFTLQTVRNLLHLSLNLEIVIGSAYQHQDSLQKIIAKNSSVHLHQNLSAEEMAGLMQTCEAAITSASSVAYEYCAVNGILFLEKTAANQTDLYNFLISENLALPLDFLAEILTSGTFKLSAKNLIDKQRTIFRGGEKW